ncbi:hypothetical protein [uncultured Phocaeicola sp.]|uniref:hypothetical protein n=1 Tax=uncultured Phocaeicola sp. TaxID=990718 RepID=UPI00261250EF|nr:hypothetical protein [uncultured Phocaeicola sp.]
MVIARCIEYQIFQAVLCIYCKTSSLKVKIWCEQHGITAKAIDYHTRRLRRKGYTIPQRIPQTFPCEKQEMVCLDATIGAVGGLVSRMK